MIPIGRTYLIECDPPENITNEGGIFVVNNIDKLKDGFWKGKVIAYGTLFTEEEKKDLVPIGSEVIMDVKKKADIKIVIKGKVFYVRKEDEILGVIE